MSRNNSAFNGMTNSELLEKEQELRQISHRAETVLSAAQEGLREISAVLNSRKHSAHSKKLIN